MSEENEKWFDKSAGETFLEYRYPVESILRSPVTVNPMICHLYLKTCNNNELLTEIRDLLVEIRGTKEIETP